MKGFRSRAAVEDVFRIIDERVASVGIERVPLAEAAGRILGEPVRATSSVPGFDRAAMDGYAVQGEETYGAQTYSPISFTVVGISRPGRRFPGEVRPGQAVEIATGAPIPRGADTVVPFELTQREGVLLSVHEAVPVGRHVGRIGEDIREGTDVLPEGRVLRPQDLGILSGLGIAEIPVRNRPRIAILVTGDELLAAGSAASEHRFADMNSPLLAAAVRRDGGVAEVWGPFPDHPSLLRERLCEATGAADAVLVSGGSSAGPEDHAPPLVSELGELLVHGVALRPASPTGLGILGGTPILLLPGNPVSCLCAYDLFGSRLVRRLSGRPAVLPYHNVERPLAHKLTSGLGRVDYVRVRLTPAGEVEPIASSGASILSSTTRADGFVLVPANLEGYAAGAIVTVWLYDVP